ncbi:family A G protein-coupled receptor-like protein [Durotheca rogersii]|uniref:family A G protein-coupled receptor-like protein n=1 Tax=Durotheca rogersii TaxID=419775 RepID=UPI00221F0F4C|nr:family A G protein-coupled receptor-like protein [Durotheca rogersii]KAI5867158.1 family A G protein-coupled receptor-like protein [Durotheca rogersii]
MADGLTPGQLEAVVVIERVGSVFSILGCVFIIVTFLLFKAFHKPINRLVFYASFGNLMTNVGTLMAREYVTQVDSFGCQFQAFLIQMFMPADALWILAMAFNVYLTFYHKFDARRLRSMEIWYLLICYGIPFVPALTFIFVQNESAGRMYGDALLWCWVSSEWDIFRIATFYGPVWVTILLTMSIYIRTGGEIWRKRKQLRYFGASSSSAHDPEPFGAGGPYTIKTTEVTVTTEAAEEGQDGIDLAPLGRLAVPKKKAAYSVTISSAAPPPTPQGDTSSVSASARDSMPAATTTTTTTTTSTVRGRTAASAAKSQRRRANFEASNAAWSYSKCAILFFTALLVTWLPSSANRAYGVVNHDGVQPALEIMSAVVLPLQGFWNTLIYVATSWEAVKMTAADVMARGWGGVQGERAATATAHFGGGGSGGGGGQNEGGFHDRDRDRRAFAFRLSGRGGRKDPESESMTELATEGDDTRSSSRDAKGQT